MITAHSFLKDVQSHQIHVYKDDGVYRHVRFRKPDSFDQMFEMITWPGGLCYTGDMGTFVFERLEDMFWFFRSKSPADARLDQIPYGYWAEKVCGANAREGLEEFDETRWRDAVKSYLRGWMRSHRAETTAEARAELWERVQDEVLNVDGDSQGVRQMVATHDFSARVEGVQRPFYFVDFHETRVSRFTDRFIWCCLALRWGVHQYDQYLTNKKVSNV